MSRTCEQPVPLDEGAAWLLGELSAEDEMRVEEHLFACESCARAIERLQRLGRDVADLLRGGRFPVAVTSDLLQWAEREGVCVRSYRMRPGEEVHCTASPRDDFVAVHLAVEAEDAESVDLVADVTLLDTGERFSRVTEDVVLDRARGELTYLFPGAVVRGYPRSRWELTARTHDEQSRRLGSYAMNHTPWELTDEAGGEA